MHLIIWGTSETPINIGEFLIKCPHCEKSSWADIMVTSKYFVFYLPIFPTQKDANVICKECGLKRYGIDFDKNLVSNYEGIKREYRHPLFTYSGLIIIGIFLIIIIVSHLVRT